MPDPIDYDALDQAIRERDAARERDPAAGRMSDTEKVAAFDNLAVALTNQWASGQWCWFCLNPAGGSATMRTTREEAVADLVAWAERTAKKRSKRVNLHTTGA